jgi:hypothetical protein
VLALLSLGFPGVDMGVVVKGDLRFELAVAERDSSIEWSVVKYAVVRT